MTRRTATDIELKAVNKCFLPARGRTSRSPSRNHRPIARLVNSHFLSKPSCKRGTIQDSDLGTYTGMAVELCKHVVKRALRQEE